MKSELSQSIEQNLSDVDQLFILFRDEQYKVERFQSRHIFSVLGLLSEGLANLEREAAFCQAFTEIVCPSFPRDLILQSPSGIKLLDIDEDELNQLLLQVLLCHYKQVYAKKLKADASEDDLVTTKNDINQTVSAYLFTRSGAIQQINSIDSIQLSTEEISRLGEEDKQKQIQSLQEKLKALQHE